LSIVPDLYAEGADITLTPLTANTTSLTVPKLLFTLVVGELAVPDLQNVVLNQVVKNKDYKIIR
jgi:hypothetical protein